MYESYTVSADTHRLATKALLREMSSPLLDPNVCQGLPQFLLPFLPCSGIISPVSFNTHCPPQKIIIKTPEHNFTYVQAKKHSRTEKSLRLKGSNYKLVRERDDHYGEDTGEVLFRSITESTDTHAKTRTIRCNLEATLPDELHNLPEVVCQFLAPSLHDLFNCSIDSQCMKYVVVMDPFENKVSKVPVKHTVQPTPPCPSCLIGGQSAYALLLEVLQAFIKMLFDSKVLCKMVPSSWLIWIPNCAAAASIATTSEELCPPNAIFILIENSAFKYTLYQGDGEGEDQPTIEWHNHVFVFEKIITDEDIRHALQDTYQLDFDSEVVQESLPPEVYAMPRQESSHKGSSASSAASDASLSISRRIPDTPLREYIGQNDIFLPLNAPEVSCHTL